MGAKLKGPHCTPRRWRTTAELLPGVRLPCRLKGGKAPTAGTGLAKVVGSMSRWSAIAGLMLAPWPTKWPTASSSLSSLLLDPCSDSHSNPINARSEDNALFLCLPAFAPATLTWSGWDWEGAERFLFWPNKRFNACKALEASAASLAAFSKELSSKAVTARTSKRAREVTGPTSMKWNVQSDASRASSTNKTLSLVKFRKGALPLAISSSADLLNAKEKATPCSAKLCRTHLCRTRSAASNGAFLVWNMTATSLETSAVSERSESRSTSFATAFGLGAWCLTMNQNRSCKDWTTAEPASGKECMHPFLGQVGIKGYGWGGAPTKASSLSGSKVLRPASKSRDMVLNSCCLPATMWRASGKPSNVPMLQGLPQATASPASCSARSWIAATEDVIFLACAKREYRFFSSALVLAHATWAALDRCWKVPSGFCNMWSWQNRCQPFEPFPFVLERDHSGLLKFSFHFVCCFSTRFRHSWVVWVKRQFRCLAAMLLSFGFFPVLTVAHWASLAKTRSMNVLVGTTRCSTASKNFTASASSMACSGTLSRSCLAKASSWQSRQLNKSCTHSSFSAAGASGSTKSAKDQGYCWKG